MKSSRSSWRVSSRSRARVSEKPVTVVALGAGGRQVVQQPLEIRAHRGHQVQGLLEAGALDGGVHGHPGGGGVGRLRGGRPARGVADQGLHPDVLDLHPANLAVHVTDDGRGNAPAGGEPGRGHRVGEVPQGAAEQLRLHLDGPAHVAGRNPGGTQQRDQQGGGVEGVALAAQPAGFGPLDAAERGDETDVLTHPVVDRQGIGIQRLRQRRDAVGELDLGGLGQIGGGGGRRGGGLDRHRRAGRCRQRLGARSALRRLGGPVRQILRIERVVEGRSDRLLQHRPQLGEVIRQIGGGVLDLAEGGAHGVEAALHLGQLLPLSRVHRLRQGISLDLLPGGLEPVHHLLAVPGDLLAYLTQSLRLVGGERERRTLLPKLRGGRPLRGAILDVGDQLLGRAQAFGELSGGSGRPPRSPSGGGRCPHPRQGSPPRHPLVEPFELLRLNEVPRPDGPPTDKDQGDHRQGSQTRHPDPADGTGRAVLRGHIQGLLRSRGSAAVRRPRAARSPSRLHGTALQVVPSSESSVARSNSRSIVSLI